jgi:tripartite-type tricarboxylate transporter receptor subunit TctC
VAACARQRSASGPYPSKDITFIIPTAAGGGGDTYARLLGAALERRLGGASNVIPLNIASGGGGKGVTRLYRAPADGYTIGILGVPGIFILQQLRGLPYDFDRFSWLGSLTAGEHYGLAVPARSSVKSLEDLRQLSALRPVLFSATGPEATAYSATLISASMLGLRSRVVTGYKGSNDYVIGALRGDTDAVVTPLSVIHRMQAGGQLRALATFEERSSFPGVPDATALGRPELAAITVERVLAAPPGLTTPIRDVLSQALVACANDRDVQEYARRIGERIVPREAAETATLVSGKQAFFRRWQSVTEARR